MIRKSVLAAAVAALLTPAVATALGLGNIEVRSALNEPLRARIPVRGAEPGDLEALRARLGSDTQFQRAGVERVFLLTKLRFKVVETGGSSGYIELTTREPVAEPFLNFLVDVTWSRGRVLREYTVLLDPPVYGAAIATGAGRQVKTVPSLPEPGMAVAPAAPPSVAMRPPAPMPTAPSAPRYVGDSYGPVRDGETLWSIAERVRPSGVSIQSTMLALLKANPQAFSIDNINALRSGAVLRIPTLGELDGGKAAALAEVARQHGLWEEYRQSLSGAVTSRPAGIPAPGAATAPGAPAAGTGPAARGTGQTTDAELKLVGAGTAGAGGAAADLQGLRNELTMAQEDADAAKRENEDLQSRLTEAETLVEDLKRLVQLKEDQLADLQNKLAEAAAAPAAPPEAPAPAMPEPATPVTTPEQPAAPTPAPAPPPAARPPAPPPPPPPPRSFMDEINDMLPVPLWTILAGIGALLLGLGGARYARSRKATAAATALGVPAVADSEVFDDAATQPGLGAAQDELQAAADVDAAPAQDATMVDDAVEDIFKDTDEAAPAVEAPGDDEDPLAEVNVYLAYERFDQAEQLVRDAVSTYPDRHAYKLKLLEVFYAAKNLVGFETAARELSDAVGDDHEMMQQAREWWSDLGAGRGLFEAEAAEAAAAEGEELFDITAQDDGGGTGVDFDVGVAEGEAGAAADVLDFDLSADEEAEQAGSGVDFDPGGTEEEAGRGSETNLDFDLGGLADETETPDAGSVPERIGAAGAGTDSGLDFDLGGLEEAEEGAADEAPAPAGEEAGVASSGLDFDLSDTALVDEGDVAPAQAPGAEEESADIDWNSGLDFDLGETGTLAEAADAPSMDRDTMLDFDLSDTGPLGEEEGAAGEGRETGLDFDLGDTGGEDEATAAADIARDTGLDFDLGDTGAKEDDAEKAADLTVDSGLDFDLGDTDAKEGEDAQAADLTVDSGLDFDLGDTGGKDDAAELDLTLDDGELKFDLEDEGGPSSIDTVQLSPDQAGAAREADAGQDSDFAVDTEFRGIFDSMDQAEDEGGGTSVDFDLGTDLEGEQAADDLEDTQYMLPEVTGAPASEDDTDDHTLALGRGGGTGEVDEMQTKLDLAQAYMDMGDSEGARNLLGEVLAEGDDAQKGQAKEMLGNLT